MKSKRRAVKSQPIRKRKKQKQKQVLAKVAERKELKQQKLERKIAEADARINAAHLASLSLPTSQISQKDTKITSIQPTKKTKKRSRSELRDDDVLEIDSNDDGDDDDDDVDDADDGIDSDEDREHAFNQLVGQLAKPLHVGSSHVEKTASKLNLLNTNSSEKQQGHVLKPGESKSRKDGASKTLVTDANQKSKKEDEEKQHEFVGILFKTVDVENRAAALRENEHFAHGSASENDLTSANVVSSYKKIAEWPHLRLLVSSGVSEAAANTLTNLIKDESSPISLGIQLTALRRWQTHRTFQDAITLQKNTPLLRGAAAAMRAFHDLLVCAGVQPHIDNSLRSLYVTHCVSHVLRCRARVLRNNIAVNEKNEEEEQDEIDETEKDGQNVPDEDALRDRGFVRARVLILVPMRNIAYDVVNQIVLLAGGDLTVQSEKEKKKNAIQIINHERFEEEFSPGDEDDIGIDNDSIGSLQSSSKYNHGMQDTDVLFRTRSDPSREHSRIFRGNVDDDFKMGISLSKKAIKLFSDFYDSDFIIASPLGLRRSSAAKATGQDKHSRVMREKRKRDEDTEWKSGIDSKVEKHDRDDNDNGFLSSIEICVLDGADIFSMQNWDTLQRTMAMVSNMPTCTRDTDFSRVREYFLDGAMKHFRQTLVFSRYRKSDVMALFRQFNNHAGKVQLLETASEHGVMSHVSHRIRQSFFKVPGCTSPAAAPDTRLVFFFNHTFPAVRALVDAQVLLVVPSYFDFVRVRNRLVAIQEDDPSLRFSSVCEYSRAKDVVRARSMLFDRSISLIVITERFHFFWRHWIRGATTIVWYGLPDNAHFYPEFLNMTEEAADADRAVQSLAIYDQFDMFALERIVGPARCRRMTSKTSRSTYMFV